MSYIPKINNNRLGDDAVTTEKIMDGEVGTDDLALDAVTGDQIADDAVGSEHIADGAVGEDQLASESVTSDKIADGTIVDGDISETAAIALSKLATDPLDRENHTGTQEASTISDFDDQVRTSRLDQMAAPEADVDMAGNKLTGLGEPVADDDAATKGYVDSVAMGLDVKASVRVASQADVDLSGPGSSIDGVSLSAGDRVLVKAQDAAEENGIYVFNGAASAMTRAEDADEDAEVTAGMFTFVEEGTNEDQGWVLATDGPVDLGVTELAFSQFSNAVIVSTLDSLTDVDVSGAHEGSALWFNGTSWEDTSDITVHADDKYIAVWQDRAGGFYTSSALGVNALNFYDETTGGAISYSNSDITIAGGQDGIVKPFNTATQNSVMHQGIRTYSTSSSVYDAGQNGDHIVLVDSSGGAVTMTLPASPAYGLLYQMKDAGGAAETNNITVAGNGNNIDGNANFVIDVNYQSVTLLFDGAAWHVL